MFLWAEARLALPFRELCLALFPVLFLALFLVRCLPRLALLFLDLFLLLPLEWAMSWFRPEQVEFLLPQLALWAR